METAILRKPSFTLSSIADLIEESEREHLKLLSSLRDDWSHTSRLFEDPAAALYQIYLDGDLAGICGLTRDPFNGSPFFGRIRPIYVRPPCRRLGLGTALIDHVCKDASVHFSKLLLLAASPQMDRLATRLGFERSDTYNVSTHIMPLGRETAAATA